MTIEEHEKILEEKLRICYNHALELGFAKGFNIGKEVGFKEGFRNKLTLEDIRQNMEIEMEINRQNTREFIINPKGDKKND